MGISLNHITLATKNIEKSFTFYHDILGLKPLVKWDNGAYFLLGDKKANVWFCLNVDKNRKPTRCYTHYAFNVTQKTFETLSARILNSGIKVFKNNTSPGNSLYFLDPDDHKLETHVGNWRTRIKAKKANLENWKNVTWFV
jgi:catechol 2,3-dioxygenase-like lactoylglutathione lyase family enzyme